MKKVEFEKPTGTDVPKKMHGCLKLIIIGSIILFIIPVTYYIITPKEKLLENDRYSATQDSIKKAEKEIEILPYRCRQTLTDLVKNNLKDPNSYEERSLEHKVNSDGTISVYLTYAGTNSFGGKIQDKISADFDSKGNIIKINK